MVDKRLKTYSFFNNSRYCFINGIVSKIDINLLNTCKEFNIVKKNSNFSKVFKFTVDNKFRVIFLKINKEFAMDGLQNIARQQVSQMSHPSAQGRAAAEQTHQATVVQQMQKEDMHPTKKITSEDEVNALVKKMNEALSPFNTSIKFGVDTQDTFYVSVIDSKDQKMIRRFPVEQAVEFLPKMKEFTGILFDTKG